MAQNINYGSEIKNGGTIKSEHVSQFVDAFTAVEAYDINISGSLDVEGTISGSFVGDGSGLTGITGGGGTGSLTTKAGNIPSSSFQDTGSQFDSFATITFLTPFSSSDYSVAVEFVNPNQYFSISQNFEIKNKTTESFQLFNNYDLATLWGNPLYPGCSVDYIAVANTETSVFTIPTSSFGLNTKSGTVPTSSLLPFSSGSYNSSASVVFATPFLSTDYEVIIDTTLRDGFQTIGNEFDIPVINKSTTGFDILSTLTPGNFGSYPSSTITYLATAKGETAVTSSFTLLSATASYVEQAQTASYALTASFALNNITFETLQVTNGTASIARDLPLPDDIEVIQPNTLNSSGYAYIRTTSAGATINAVLPKCTSFNLPNNLRIIGDNNFIGHESPESIILPPNTEIVSTSSFANVQTEIISCSNALTSIGPGAFFNSISNFPERDTYLKSITLNEGLQTIGEGAFCTAYDGGAYMNQSRFYVTESISVTIPSSVTFIDSASFFNRAGLNSVTFSPRTSSLIIGELAFYGPLSPYSSSISNETTESTSFPLRINSIEIPDNTTLYRGAFNSQAIETASIGDNCTLFWQIFSLPGGGDVSNLMDRFKRPRINSFTLPDTTILVNNSISQTPLASAAFNNVIFSGSGWTEIPSGSFYNSVLKGFPDISQTNIDTVNSNTFDGVGFATSSLILPVSMSYSGSSIFPNVKLSSSIDVSASNDYSLTIGDHSDFTNKVIGTNAGSFYKTDISNLIIGNNVTFATADEVTNVNQATFYQNYIRSMTIGENVTFGKGTMSDNQTKITGSTVFPATTTFYSSSFPSFDNNSSPDSRGFDSVVFSGSGTTTIPLNCFNSSGVKALEFIGSGIQTLGSSSFKDNDITGSVTFPSTLTDIGPLAFDGNNNLATASIPTACITASNSFESSVHIIRF